MVTVSDVRKLLNNLPSGLVPDEVIQQNIDTASDYVDAVKTASADAMLVERAKLVYAAYLTAVSYSTAVERTGRTVPSLMLNQAGVLRELLTELMAAITGRTGAVFVVDQPETITEVS